MATSTAFCPRTTTKKLTAAAASSSATWSDADKNGDCVRIFNENIEPVFVRLGSGAQTATLDDLPIAGLSVEVIGCNSSDDTIAVITSGAGGAAVYVTKGEGV